MLLQKDIITDPSEIQAVAGSQPVPNFLDLLGSDIMQGTLVTQKFNTVDELKQIRPVREVRGRVLGGPFSLADATRVAGEAVLKKIFNRGGGGGSGTAAGSCELAAYKFDRYRQPCRTLSSLERVWRPVCPT
jgi:hypothetical protein